MNRTKKGSVTVIMGVAGSGKSTIARRLASKLKCEFVDADRYHSAENVAKMAAGIALTDEDRKPWLDSLSKDIGSWLSGGETVVLACSALKRAYRDRLRAGGEADSELRFVYLKGSKSLFADRLARRKGHFMKEKMLDGQFAALEEPDEKEAIIVDAAKPVKEILDEVLARVLPGRWNTGSSI